MSLVLLATVLAIGSGRTSSFAGSGGTGPYTYAVLPGGIGGTIDIDGVYTAPLTNSSGTDTVQVTDSLTATATQVILVGTAIELVCDIIRTQMGLATDQVYEWDQKYKVPSDSRLYIAVGISSCKPFGNTLSYTGTSSPSTFGGVQSVNMLARLDINIFSRSTLATTMKEGVLFALASNYSEQQQEVNSFSIARIPTGFVNISQVEGAAILYRYVISVNVQYFVVNLASLSYFDNNLLPVVEQVES